MLSAIREGSRSIFAKLFIWLIALTFVGAAFLVWGDVQPAANAIAIVGEKEISQREYTSAVAQIEARLRSQFGSDIDPSLYKTLNAPRIALDSIINSALQEEAAIEAGFHVTDKELKITIENSPEFLVEGVFDTNRYFDLLRMNNLTPAEFESKLKQDLLLSRLKRSIERVASITDAEAYVRFLYEHQPIAVKFVKVRSAALVDEVKVAEEELKKWYAQNSPQFLEPEERSFRMLSLPASSFEEKVTVTDEEIKEYYEQNISEFKIKESVRASHIIIETGPNATTEKIAEAREKIGMAYDRVVSGEDFEQVARELSEGPTAPKGGDLGEFTRGMMVPVFEQVVFTTEPGQFSEPFHTQFGWHIAKTIEHTQAGIPELANVLDKVTLKVKNHKAKDVAKKLMKKIAATVAPENFAAVTDANPQILVNSYTVKRGAVSQSPDYPTKVAQETLNLGEKQVSHVMEVPGGYAVAIVDTVTPPYAPTLEKIHVKVERKYRLDKAQTLADDIALKIERAVNEGEELEKVAMKEGLKVETTKPFAREAFIDPARVKDDGMLMEAFELGDDEAKSVPYQGDHLVIMVALRFPADKELAKEKIPQIKESLKEGRKIRVYNEFVNDLRKKADESGKVKVLVDLK